MAVLHNFLDERVKSHEYLKLANSIVDDLPPEIIPRVRWYFEVYLTYTPTSTIGRQGPVVCTHRDSCEGHSQARWWAPKLKVCLLSNQIVPNFPRRHVCLHAICQPSTPPAYYTVPCQTSPSTSPTCWTPPHQGFHGLLEYAGMAWAYETELASEEDGKAYWESVHPVWEVHGAVTGLVGVGPPRPDRTKRWLPSVVGAPCFAA